MTCGAATGLRRKGQFSVMQGSHGAGPEDEVDAAYDRLRATQPGVGAAFVAEGQRAAEDAAEWAWHRLSGRDPGHVQGGSLCRLAPVPVGGCLVVLDEVVWVIFVERGFRAQRSNLRFGPLAGDGRYRLPGGTVTSNARERCGSRPSRPRTDGFASRGSESLLIGRPPFDARCR